MCRLLAGLALTAALTCGLCATPAQAAPPGTPHHQPQPPTGGGGCYARFGTWQWMSCWHFVQHGHRHPQAQMAAEMRQLLRYLRASSSASSSSLVWHWQLVANCESGDSIYAVSPSGTYRGWLQFSRATWNAYGGPGDPLGQSRELTATIADRVRTGGQGLGAWPVCGAYYR